MPNVLQNTLQTSGLNGQQPWKQFYKGIKPVNPLGGDVVRRMGNKVKSVLPATNTRNMQFSYMDSGIAHFKSDPNYIPPYKPLPGQLPQYYTVEQSSPEYYYSSSPDQQEITYREQLRRQREYERSAREQRREARRAVADTRASYRTGLDTAREVRNWAGTLGVI